MQSRHDYLSHYDYEQQPAPQTVRRPIDPAECATDLSDLACPKCGCNSVTILKWPGNTPAWFAGGGSAECDHCRHNFALKQTEPDGSPVQPQLPSGAWFL